MHGEALKVRDRWSPDALSMARFIPRLGVSASNQRQTSMESANIPVIISAIAALVSFLFALWSYFNERRIRIEIKRDEKVLIGKPHNPSFISLADHRDCVLEIPFHNVSTTKRVFITKVEAFNRKGEPVEMSWSGSTDNLGKLVDCGDVLRIDDSANLYLRANDGECINFMSVKLFHTFSKAAQVVVFDRSADLHQ